MNFVNLPDLVLIEMMSYLSSLDLLWAFADLNDRFRALLLEGGFFHHINLSSAYLSQFVTLQNLLPWDEIQSLTIDINASPLQLARWPYLPCLTKLRLKVLHNFDDIVKFLVLHAATLTHLSIQANVLAHLDYQSSAYWVPMGDVTTITQAFFLRQLPVLQSFDLGINPETCYILRWYIKTVRPSLTYLRLALKFIDDLWYVMSTQNLSKTLEQLHITIANHSWNMNFRLPAGIRRPQLTLLRTFTLVQSFFSDFKFDWTVVEILTGADVMPVLRRANVAILLTVDDLDLVAHSSLFNDHRHVDVHFAFSFPNRSEHVKLVDHIPHGCRFYSRQIMGMTVMNNIICRDECPKIVYLPHFDHFYSRIHIWFTWPWAFNEFFEQPVVRRYITDVQLLVPPGTTSPSSFLTSRMDLYRELSWTVPYPHILSPDHINTLHLHYSNTATNIALPILRHLTLTNCTSSLLNVSLLSRIRSIEIILHYRAISQANWQWSALRSLLSSPTLASLRIFLYDFLTSIDDSDYQIIAATAISLANFWFAFRRCTTSREGYKQDQQSIEALRRRILFLSVNRLASIHVERDGCELIVWV